MTTEYLRGCEKALADADNAFLELVRAIGVDTSLFDDADYDLAQSILMLSDALAPLLRQTQAVLLGRNPREDWMSLWAAADTLWGGDWEERCQPSTIPTT